MSTCLKIRLLVVDSLPCHPVDATDGALKVGAGTLALKDVQVLRRVWSAVRAADRTQLGDVSLTKGVDGLYAAQFVLIDTAMDSPAFLIVKGFLEA